METISTNKARAIVRKHLILDFEVDIITVYHFFDYTQTINGIKFWEYKQNFISLVEEIKLEIKGWDNNQSLDLHESHVANVKHRYSHRSHNL